MNGRVKETNLEHISLRCKDEENHRTDGRYNQIGRDTSEVGSNDQSKASDVEFGKKMEKR